jgi:hypothetical protein
MNDLEYRKERRKQRQAEHFPSDAACMICGEKNACCLQSHHVAGRAFGDDQVIVCQNHHSQLTDKQKDHPPTSATRTECKGRKLLGTADLMELLHNPHNLVELVRRTGLDLIERGRLCDQPERRDQP